MHEAKMYFAMCYQCPNIKHKTSTLYTQVVTYIIKMKRMSHIYLTKTTLQDNIRIDSHTIFFHRDGKTFYTDRTTQTYTGQDKEYDDEDLNPDNWIPCTGVSSGSGSGSGFGFGSGSGSSGWINFSISRSLKNVNKGCKIVA